MTDLIDTTEMYLRTLYELHEEGVPLLRVRIAEQLGHSGPTVSQTVARMERVGLLVVQSDRRVELTEEGMLRARRVMRKHRLVERLLVDVIGLPMDEVHDEACRWEHVVSESVERRLLNLVSDAAESPFGNPIPALEELDAPAAADFRAGLVPLTGASGRVTLRRIGEGAQTREALELLKLTGLRPGVVFTVEPVRRGFHVKGPDGTAELPAAVARHLWVAW